MAYQDDIKLLPHAINEIAAAVSESLYGKYPVGLSNYDAGFQDITYRQLLTSQCYNGGARWIEHEIGRGDPEHIPVLAYIGPNDFRHVFAFVGAVKAGY